MTKNSPVINEISHIRRAWSANKIKEYIGALQFWRGEGVEVEQILGGLQNRTYFITKSTGEKFVARVGFDQYRTRQTSVVNCTIAAHKLGVGPALIYAEPNLSITEFLVGSRMELEQMKDPSVIKKVIDCMKVVHEGSWAVPETISYWWPFDTVRRYLNSMENGKEVNGFQPSKWVGQIPKFRQITDALEKVVAPYIPKLTHNDMVFPNMFFHPEGHIMLIDWDGGSYGHPMWDLAEMLMWAEADEAVSKMAVSYYYGEITKPKFDQCMLEIKAFQIMAALRLITETMETDLDPLFFLSADEMSESMKIVLPGQRAEIGGLVDLLTPVFEDLLRKYAHEFEGLDQFIEV